MTYVINSSDIQIECDDTEYATVIADAFRPFSSRPIPVIRDSTDVLHFDGGWEAVKILLDPTALDAVLAAMSVAGGLIVGGGLKEVGKDIYEAIKKTVRRCLHRQIDKAAYRSPEDRPFGVQFWILPRDDYPRMIRSGYVFEPGRRGKVSAQIDLQTVLQKDRSIPIGADEKVTARALEHLERKVAPKARAVIEEWPETELTLQMNADPVGNLKCLLYISPTPETHVLLDISPQGVEIINISEACAPIVAVARRAIGEVAA
jgi:hypothetical protein